MLEKRKEVGVNSIKERQHRLSYHENIVKISPRIFMNGCELDISSSFTQLGPSVSFNQTWIHHIRSIAKHAFQKLGFLSRVHGYFLSRERVVNRKWPGHVDGGG